MTPRGEKSAAILVDTNVFLRLVSVPDQIPDAVREVLSEPSTTLMVSAASAWEIAIKTRLGRLDGTPLLAAWADIMADMIATEVSIDADDAIFADRLPWEHKDPFDRMIVAQAARRNLTIATSDILVLRAALTPTLKA
ncbi:type II toxin-antitoxin system VapC family toxin [Mycolicibacterium thermoresistibile]